MALPAGGRHYPDLLAVLPSGRFHAVEVELTPKNLARRERILGGYARARHIETVTYHVATPAIGRLVTQTAASVGISDLLTVEPIDVAAAA